MSLDLTHIQYKFGNANKIYYRDTEFNVFSISLTNSLWNTTDGATGTLHVVAFCLYNAHVIKLNVQSPSLVIHLFQLDRPYDLEKVGQGHPSYKSF